MMKDDEKPLSNHFEGRMNSTRLSGNDAIEVDMNMDYRYFLMSNKNYYDELSTMSLLMANSIYRRGENQDLHSGVTIFDDKNICTEEEKNNGIEYMSKDNKNYKNLRVKGMMEHFGFQNVKVYYLGSTSDEGYDPDNSDETGNTPICRNYTDTHKGSVAIGYHNIEYHGINKSVVGIIIRGTAEDDDWDNDFDMGDVDLRNALNYESGYENYQRKYNSIKDDLADGILDKYDNKYSTELLHFAGGYPDWIHQYHHAGFDIVANRIMEIIENYMETETNGTEDVEEMNGNYCFWITGHSMGAGVSNIVAAELLHGSSGINDQTDNVYCYTFASPNTFYITDNVNKRRNYALPDEEVTETYREPKTTKYRCIFNIVNSDDFVPKVPMAACNWTKYGRTAEVSVNDIKSKIPENFSPIYDPYGSYYKLWVKYSYNTKPFLINTIINCFNEIYSDKNNMRNMTYKYDDYTIFSNNESTLKDNLPFYAKAYQTYSKTSIRTHDLDSNKYVSGCEQEQMPAYFMQSIANAMHEYVPYYNDRKEIEKRPQNKDETFLGQKVTENQKTLCRNKMIHSALWSKWAMIISEGMFKVIDNPHYPESYYSLTKEVSVNDFR